MSIGRSLSISASGLTAERLRMDVISNNLANINTTVTAEGTPYRRQHVVFAANDTGSRSFSAMLRTATNGSTDAFAGGGVKVAGVEKDQGDFKRVKDPTVPGGYALLPNIEPVMEMVDLITATRAYDAGVTAIGASKQMQQRALEIGKG
jgi:flagellar basal-body rod protein FlgC